jgi:hypothetical protein
MVKELSVNEIDEALIQRLAGLSRGTQRWLKTALQSITTMPGPQEPEPDLDWALPKAAEADQRREHQSPLEDVISGKAKLDDQLEAFPELADELEGIGDVIDMLRDLGESRRRRGSDILREEILGDPPSDEDDDDERDEIT